MRRIVLWPTTTPHDGVDPANIVRRRACADTRGRVTPYLVLVVDHALRGLNLGHRSDYARLLDNHLGKRRFKAHNGLLRAAGWVLDLLRGLLDWYSDNMLTSLIAGVTAMLIMLVVLNLDKLGAGEGAHQVTGLSSSHHLMAPPTWIWNVSYLSVQDLDNGVRNLKDGEIHVWSTSNWIMLLDDMGTPIIGKFMQQDIDEFKVGSVIEFSAFHALVDHCIFPTFDDQNDEIDHGSYKDPDAVDLLKAKVPRDVVFSKFASVGGVKESWSAVCYILTAEFANALPHDEDQMPLNGNPHPLPGQLMPNLNNFVIPQFPEIGWNVPEQV
ncbi:hypothetical protein ACQ4PT_070756 [Festuca glaucescens]